MNAKAIEDAAHAACAVGAVGGSLRVVDYAAD
jgi:hypothetical protein